MGKFQLEPDDDKKMDQTQVNPFQENELKKSQAQFSELAKKKEEETKREAAEIE